MIITQTPLRVSFLGGGTDYPEYFLKHGGAVLGTAVDKSAYFSISHFYSQLFDYSIRIAYSQVECVRALEEIKHAPFRECLRWAGIHQDVEINHAAELPAFTGLGSSSSFVVGLLNTVYAFQGRVKPSLELAYEAIDLERKVLRESVGCQDQTFAAVGGFNLIEFRGAHDFVVNRIPLGYGRLAEFEEHLLVFFTGLKRRAEDMAARQVKRVGENSNRLAQLRRMVDDGYRILVGGASLAPFGEVLHAAWELKRQLDAAISNDTVNQIYDAGMEAGALGGKLLGAGGGGFLLFFVPPERKAAVRQRLGHLPEVELRVNASGTHVVHCGMGHWVAPVPRRREAA
jgi:D-glycero-alpha-D-manno-heptose-7-phosphate kinase